MTSRLAAAGSAAAVRPRRRRRGGGRRRAQPYLLVSNGGGGIIRNIWLQGGAPPTGLRGENTSTPRKIYQLSNEHHGRVEVVLRNVQNWEFHCLQTEEESGQQNAYALDIEDCRNILFANTYMYRVSRIVKPVTYAVKVRNSDNIVFDNVHIFSQTRLPFDNAVLEEGSGVAVRANNFTHLVVSKSMKKGDPLPLPAVFARDARWRSWPRASATPPVSRPRCRPNLLHRRRQSKDLPLE